MGGAERAKFLFRIARMLQERSREFAVLETIDGGKPIKEARDVDLPLAAAHFFYYAGWADKLEYAFPGVAPEPLGVAGQVIPWNFPMMMLAWKVAPALATGNTVVLKPAETTPLTALLFAELAAEAGLPPGVLNIVTGAGRTGAALVEHPGRRQGGVHRVDRGGQGHPACAGRVGQEAHPRAGGKGAHVIFDDAPVDQAVEGVINGIFFNQGHVCCAGSRLFIQESIYDHFLDKLRNRLGTLRVGDPLDKNTDIGAINSAEQLQRIEALVTAGVDEGADLYQPDCELPARGYFFRPTLFTGVSQSHRIAQEEIFGPVLSVMSFRTPAEAVEKANNTPYGLSAGVWTTKGSRILWMADRLRAGVVWANTYNKFDPTSPFGGYRESGFGREGGRHGLAGYLEGTVVVSRLAVKKTHKLYIGGKFPRSESGRSYPAVDAAGEVVARVAWASRKDLRDAVRSARGAQPGWAGLTAYNRGQILYRIAEMIEDRTATFTEQVAFTGSHRRRGGGRGRAGDRLDRVVRRVGGQVRPDPRQPEPGGRAVLQHLGTRAVRGHRGGGPGAAVAARVVAPGAARDRVGQHRRGHRQREPWPVPAVSLTEVLRHLRSARRGRQPAHRAACRADPVPCRAHGRRRHRPHRCRSRRLAAAASFSAAENVKRVVVGRDPLDRSPYFIADFTETKTVWHPKGL